MQTTIEHIAKGAEVFDMNRMQNILERCILEYYSNLESNPHEAIAFASIADSLYGEKKEDVGCYSLIYFLSNIVSFRIVKVNVFQFYSFLCSLKCD